MKMADTDRDEEFDEIDRREYRRKRRMKNQIIAYVSATVIMAVVIAGAGIGIHKGITSYQDKKNARELQAQLEEMSAQQEEPVVVEAPAASPEEETQEQLSPLDEIVNAQIETMPIEDKVAGLFVITPEALTGTDQVTKAGDTTKEKLTQYAVGGLVYFKQNISSGDQLKEMISNTDSYSKYPLFIAADEEGGSVSRLAAAGLAENVGTMKEIGASGNPDNAKTAGSSIASYLTEYGFNLDFAPIADVVTEGNTSIGDRSFGTNAGDVATYVAKSVEGLQEGGVSACLKHFPGLGSVDEDSHEGMVVSEKTLEDFETTDFLSFQAGIDAGADFVMVGHLSVPGITGDNTPCTLSEKMITEVLRGQMGFDGVVITDSMAMSAITDYYTADEAAVKALQAGADMILMPEDFETAYQGVLDAVNNGTLTEDRINESLVRIYRVKLKDRAS